MNEVDPKNPATADLLGEPPFWAVTGDLIGHCVDLVGGTLLHTFGTLLHTFGTFLYSLGTLLCVLQPRIVFRSAAF